MASNEATNNLAMSLWSTCSGFLKNERIQNKIIAPNTRKSVTTSGVTMPPSITNLAIGDIKPQMEFSGKHRQVSFYADFLHLLLPIFS